MASALILMQIASGLAISGSAWLATRQAMRKRDRAITDALRQHAPPLIRPVADRQADAGQHARSLAERLVQLDAALPQDDGPYAATAPAPAAVPVGAVAAVSDIALIPDDVAQVQGPAPSIAPAITVAGGVPPQPTRDGTDGPTPSIMDQTTHPAAAGTGLSDIFIKDSERSIPDQPQAKPAKATDHVEPSSTAFTGFTLRPSPRSATAAPPAGGRDPAIRPPPDAGASGGAGICWVGSDMNATVRGTRIGGMVYVGEHLPNPGGWGTDRCLINPALPIARKYQRGEDTGLAHWPEYAALKSAGRRGYIDWLSQGRSDPLADIGFVFLFFYGLERRLFHDRAVADAPALSAEVDRLLAIYGDQQSFRHYATEFLAAAALVSGQAIPRIEPGPTMNWHAELPLSTLVQLGTLLATGQALQADDALLWVLGTPDTRLRTPGQRCFPELRQVFATRFAERYPRNLTIPQPKRRLKVTYQAASNEFTAVLLGLHESLPDISSITAPLAGLRDLLDASQTDLDAYSRLLGRKPDARGTLEAAVLLPPLLRASAAKAAMGQARTALLSLLKGSSIGTVTPGALFRDLGMDFDTSAKRIPAAALAQLLPCLDAVGFGIEPDRRYGGGAMVTDTQLVLFVAPGGAHVDPERPAYVDARAAMEIAILAAAVDGNVSEAEFGAVVRDTSSMPGLMPAEVLRLQALAWLSRGQATAGGALRRAASLGLEARQSIARASIAVVLSDSQVTPAEIAFLERLYRTLGLPADTLHSLLHRGTAGAAPPQGAIARLGFTLDADRLARLRQETTQVSSFLSGIFAEEPGDDTDTTSAPPAPAPPTAGAGRFDGLDSAHGALLAAVLSVASMTAAEFEAHAKQLRLLPAGAIETINDWAFDGYNDAVLDADEDSVMVASHLRAALLQSREDP